jgi:hypothetical protein
VRHRFHPPNVHLRAGTLIFVCLSLLRPCFAGKATSCAQAGVDFSQYKTYQWLPPRMLAKTGLIEDDPVIAPLVKEAVNRQRP